MMMNPNSAIFESNNSEIQPVERILNRRKFAVSKWTKHLVLGDSESADISSETDTPWSRESMENALRPLLTVMKLTGLFHNGGAKGSLKTKLYSICILVLLWLNFLRRFALFEKDEFFGAQFFFKVAVTVWAFQYAINATICFGFSKEFPTLLRVWHGIASDLPSGYYNHIHRQSLGFTIFGILSILLLEGVFTMWFFVYPDTKLPDMTVPLHFSASPPIHAIILNMIIMVFEASACVYPLALVIVFSLALRKGFRTVTRDFAKAVEQNQNLDIEEFRERHSQWCDLACMADRSFRWYILTTYITNVPMTCFILFNIVFYFMNSEALIMKLTTILALPYVLLNLFIVTVVAAMLNEAAGEPRIILYNIRLRGNSNVLLCTQIQVFLSRLCMGNIGFSAGGLFCISKQTLTTVVTMVFSYLVILFKFGTALDNPCYERTCPTNCTNVMLSAITSQRNSTGP